MMCNHFRFTPSSWKLTIIDWTSLILSESTQKTRHTHGKPRGKTSYDIMSALVMLSGIIVADNKL